MSRQVSVIIITRNRAEMLSRTLTSLIGQTRLPDEVIVVDNASDDNTKKVIHSFKKKLPVRYVMEAKIGIPYARNKGIGVSHGTILLMIDDDCTADRCWVERMVDAHKRYPKVWAIQGRTFSIPQTQPYSVLAEFNRFCSMRNYSKKTLSLRSFFAQDFRDEIELSTTDTRNFSIKTFYLKKYKLSFDKHFYRGSDTDFGRQIIQKNGLIIFCPLIQMYHRERSTLTKFLAQRWHIGRTSARIINKWGKYNSVQPTRLFTNRLFTFFMFCTVTNQWLNLPTLYLLFFLDKLYYLNGYFYEKRLLFLQKQ